MPRSCHAVFEQFQQQPTLAIDVATLEWASETSKALSILKITPKDYPQKGERATSSFSSDSDILSLKISFSRK